jgi:hypothetical protein
MPSILYTFSRFPGRSRLASRTPSSTSTTSSNRSDSPTLCGSVDGSPTLCGSDYGSDDEDVGAKESKSRSWKAAFRSLVKPQSREETADKLASSVSSSSSFCSPGSLGSFRTLESFTLENGDILDRKPANVRRFGRVWAAAPAAVDEATIDLAKLVEELDSDNEDEDEDEDEDGLSTVDSAPSIYSMASWTSVETEATEVADKVVASSSVCSCADIVAVLDEGEMSFAYIDKIVYKAAGYF